MMSNEEYYRKLENNYAAAPINEFYKPVMCVSEGRSEIEIDVTDKLFHAAGAVHGSVYFKMLDDAAFFAIHSYKQDAYYLTTTFTTYIIRPVSSGKLKSIGKVVNKSKSQCIAEAILYDSNGNEVGRGSGVFTRSTIKSSNSMGDRI
ncbi:MAG: PaaI family thioesterase [Pseudomonadota bacterium]